MPLLSGSSVFAGCGAVCPQQHWVCTGQSAAPLCPAGFSVPHLCQPWPQLLSLPPLPCTFLHNSDLDYATKLVQGWQKVQSSKGDSGLYQLRSPSRGLRKIYVALAAAATGCQRPLEQMIFWSFLTVGWVISSSRFLPWLLHCVFLSNMLGHCTTTYTWHGVVIELLAFCIQAKGFLGSSNTYHISSYIFTKLHKLAWDVSGKGMRISDFNGCMFVLFSFPWEHWNTGITCALFYFFSLAKGKTWVSGYPLFITIQNSDEKVKILQFRTQHI